ncbi:divalent cation tolerance protein CutA [Brevundimonas sp.]
MDRIAALHPYDNPCVLMLPVSSAGSSETFAAWIRTCVN